MASRIRLLVGGGVTYLGAVGVTYYYMKTMPKAPILVPGAAPIEDSVTVDHNHHVHLDDKLRQQTYSNLARNYDNGKFNQTIPIVPVVLLVLFLHRDWCR